MSESIDAENLENFKVLVSVVRSLRANYNPEYFLLELHNLEEIILNAELALDGFPGKYSEKYNAIFYAEETGLVSVAREVKKYLKEIFGEDCREYRMIKDLEFKVPAEHEQY